MRKKKTLKKQLKEVTKQIKEVTERLVLKKQTQKIVSIEHTTTKSTRELEKKVAKLQKQKGQRQRCQRKDCQTQEDRSWRSSSRHSKETQKTQKTISRFTPSRQKLERELPLVKRSVQETTKS